jgi:transcriptional regulator with XRE-family HTH domain
VDSNQVDEVKLYELIGARLKRRRVERESTQAWLAERVGMLRTSITNIEKGRQKPPLHVIYALCDALDVDPFEILPTLEEVRQFDQNVVINSDHMARLPPKTARFLRGVMDDSTRRNQ